MGNSPREEIEIATDEVHRATLFVLLGLSVFVGAVVSDFFLTGFVEFEVVY